MDGNAGYARVRIPSCLPADYRPADRKGFIRKGWWPVTRPVIGPALPYGHSVSECAGLCQEGLRPDRPSDENVPLWRVISADARVLPDRYNS